MAFLTIYTPTFRRPGMLERCVASVTRQESLEMIQHIIVRDEVGLGIAGMFAEIPRHVEEMVGDYVYILQDDDELADGRCVADVQEWICRQMVNPAVIMVRNIKRGMNLPLMWETRPVCGWVDLGGYLVKREVFAENAGMFGRRYEGDYDFIDRLWAMGYTFGWCARLFAREQVSAPGLGRAEVDVMRDVQL
jgi:hypothetical protein